MGRLFTVSLEGSFYTCKYCSTHLALCRDVRSKFPGFNPGEKCYVFEKVVNATTGEFKVGWWMTFGLIHIHFNDIYCVGCGAKIGSTYFEVIDEYDPECREQKSILNRWQLSFQDLDGVPLPNSEPKWWK